MKMWYIDRIAVSIKSKAHEFVIIVTYIVTYWSLNFRRSGSVNDELLSYYPCIYLLANNHCKDRKNMLSFKWICGLVKVLSQMTCIVICFFLPFINKISSNIWSVEKITWKQRLFNVDEVEPHFCKVSISLEKILSPL